jgi:hypothetical protein
MLLSIPAATFCTTRAPDMLSCFKGKQRAVFDDYDAVYEKHSHKGGLSTSKAPVDTTQRLAALRAAITDNKVDCYVVPR